MQTGNDRISNQFVCGRRASRALGHMGVVAALVLLPSCVFNSVKKLEPEAEHVTVVTDASRPIDCRVLGKINGSSHADDQKHAHQGAENELRNQAAKMKANFALIETDRNGPVGTTKQVEVFLTGKALACRTPEMEAEEEKRHEAELKAKEEKEQREAEEKERKEAEEKEKAASQTNSKGND